MEHIWSKKNQAQLDSPFSHLDFTNYVRKHLIGTYKTYMKKINTSFVCSSKFEVQFPGLCEGKSCAHKR